MFEKFTCKFTGREPVKPEVSIFTSGDFYLNVAAFECFNLDKYKSTYLLINKETGIIRFQLRKEKPDADALRLRITEQNGSRFALVTGKGFLNYYKINHDKTRRFNLKQIEDNILEFKIEPTELIKED